MKINFELMTCIVAASSNQVEANAMTKATHHS